MIRGLFLGERGMVGVTTRAKPILGRRRLASGDRRIGEELKNRILAARGDQVRKIILYGSRAQGGATTDVARRYKEHLSQGWRTARILWAHKRARLVFSQLVGDRALALKAEYRFRRLPRQVKARIIRAGHQGYDYDCD
jgi:putative endonuclease